MNPLEKAQGYKAPRKNNLNLTDEHIPVALAWLKGELTPSQVAVGLGLKLENGNYQRHISTLIRMAYRNGLITIND